MIAALLRQVHESPTTPPSMIDYGRPVEFGYGRVRVLGGAGTGRAAKAFC
jgi:hypothetical protein